MNKMLDRSLSQSFAEEKKILSAKYKKMNTPPDTVEEGMSHEVEEEEVSYHHYHTTSTAIIL